MGHRRLPALPLRGRGHRRSIVGADQQCLPRDEPTADRSSQWKVEFTQYLLSVRPGASQTSREDGVQFDEDLRADAPIQPRCRQSLPGALLTVRIRFVEELSKSCPGIPSRDAPIVVEVLSGPSTAPRRPAHRLRQFQKPSHRALLAFVLIVLGVLAQLVSKVSVHGLPALESTDAGALERRP